VYKCQFFEGTTSSIVKVHEGSHWAKYLIEELRGLSLALLIRWIYWKCYHYL